MSHPRHLPKQDLKAQYYSRRRSSSTSPSSPATYSQPFTLPQSQPSSPSASSSSPLNITSSQQSLLSTHSGATVDALLERSKTFLSDWESKKVTPTPRICTQFVYPEIKKIARSIPSPTLKLHTGVAYYGDWEGQVKPVAIVETAIPEEVVELEVVKKSGRESLATSVEGGEVAEEEEKDEVGMRIVLPVITNSSPPAPPAAIQPIQKERPPPPSASLPEPKPSVPAVPSPSKPAVNTPVKVSAPAAAPKEWKPKPKIHGWCCAFHRSSTSTLDPYKCTRCTKRRAASKPSFKK